MPAFVDTDTLALLPSARVVLPSPIVRTVTPAVDTNALATGDLAVTLLTPLYGVATAPGKTTVLQQFEVFDNDVESVTIELWFFDTISITLPSLNAAWAISDAHLAHVAGVVQSGTYYAQTNGSYAINKQIGLSMIAGSGPRPAGEATGALWFATIVRGAPTYTAATDLTFRFTFYPDA